MKLKAYKQEHCFALLIIAIITISIAMMTMPVAALDGDVTFDLTMYFYTNSGIIPGVSPGVYVIVDVWVDTGTLTAATGMHGYGLKVYCDPAVLTPAGANGGTAGYFMYDWTAATYPPPFPGGPLPDPPKLLQIVGLDYIEVSEYYLPLPPDGATGTGKLVTLYFQSKSLTQYSELEIDAAGTGYQDPTGAQYAVYGIDGHYNMPISGHLFEQWSGSTFPTGDPTGSDWHELEPNYCDGWTLESWVDNGDGILSPSDQIDMFQIDPPDPNVYWFHVEWVSPAPVAGDGVADMLVTLKPCTPEFPLGSVVPLGLIAAVAYIWWVTRRKRHEVT